MLQYLLKAIDLIKKGSTPFSAFLLAMTLWHLHMYPPADCIVIWAASSAQYFVRSLSGFRQVSLGFVGVCRGSSGFVGPRQFKHWVRVTLQSPQSRLTGTCNHRHCQQHLHQDFWFAFLYFPMKSSPGQQVLFPLGHLPYDKTYLDYWQNLRPDQKILDHLNFVNSLFPSFLWTFHTNVLV